MEVVDIKVSEAQAKVLSNGSIGLVANSLIKKSTPDGWLYVKSFNPSLACKVGILN
jgi:hypothetical protein